MRLLLISVGLVVAATAALGPALWTRAHPPTIDTQAPKLAGWDDPRVTRWDHEPTIGYVTRANTAATAAWAHCDRSTAQTWDSALAQQIGGWGYDRGEGTLTPQDFYCGFCGQHAIMLARILRDNGVDADAYLLNGHTVVEFTDNGATYAVDPDVGVPPFRTDRGDLEQTVRAAYAEYATYHDTGTVPFPGTVTADTAVDLYTTATGDHRYDRGYYDTLVDHQQHLLWRIHTGRWTLLALGLLLAAAGIRKRGRTQPSSPDT